jgi:hypothetical protein
MMNMISEKNPAVWTGAEQASRDWIVRLDEGDCEEIVAAARVLMGRPLESIGRADFSLPRLVPKLAAAERALAVGTGFVMLRGLPLDRLDQALVEIAYWGLSAHLGIGVSQSGAGDRLGHVFDRGTGETERYYTRGGALEFHMDPVDVVGLLCLRAAQSGGASRIISAGAIHNVMLAERPDLLAILYRGFHNSRRGHGERTPSARVPIFARGEDGLQCYFLPETIRQATEEGYPLSARELDALNYLSDVANRPDLFLDMDFRPGDIQFLNNRTILHSRTDYVDHDDPAQKRHLLRLWLMMPGWPARVRAMDFHDTVDRVGGGVRPVQA